MIIGIAGYILKTDKPFINGYTQNIIFFCEMIEKYFKEHTIIKINDSK